MIPEFTCAICTHARVDYLEACLQALAQQDPVVAFRIIVVDSGSGPEHAVKIAALATRFGVELLRMDEPGLSLARNAALAATKTTWLAYIDDDAQAAPDWSYQIVRCLQTIPDDIAVIGGRILPAWEAPVPPWWRDDDLPYLAIITAEGRGTVGVDVSNECLPAGANILFHVGRLSEIGGFDLKIGRSGTRLISNEETLAMTKLSERGGKTYFDSSIAVMHSIQAARLNVGWLVARIHWGAYSDIVLSHLTNTLSDHLHKLPRRFVVMAISYIPTRIPLRLANMLTWRRRFAYSSGEVRGFMAVLLLKIGLRQT